MQTPTKYPDIVKVRLQTSSQYSSALDGATKIFKNEGPAAFYKVCQLFTIVGANEG